MTRSSKKESLPYSPELKGDIKRASKYTGMSEEEIMELADRISAHLDRLSQKHGKEVRGIDVGNFLLGNTALAIEQAVAFLNYLGYSTEVRSAQIGARQKIDISNNPVGEEFNPSNTGEGTNPESTDKRSNNIKTTGQIVWIRSGKGSYNTRFSS